MGDVKSKNLFELLGNDHEYDSDKEPEPPTKVAEPAQARTGKRDGTAEKVDAAATAAVVSRAERDPNRRRGGFTDGDREFRQRTNRVKRDQNPNPNYRAENVIEGHEGQVRGRDSGPGTQRRGRGDRGPRRGGDRHSRTGHADHPKQEQQGWGNEKTEEADEVGAAADAKAEIATEGFDANALPPPLEGDGPLAGQDADTAFNAETAAPAEPEDNSKSYADYLVEQATKKAAALGILEARKPNEGSKPDKKFDNAKALSKEGVDENYFQGEQKQARQREKKVVSNRLDVDYSFKEEEQRSDRGGRGGRGGRGRGRGDYSDRAPRGDRDGDRPRGGRGRGEFRGRGDRGVERRGGRGDARGGSNGTALTMDDSSFPSLGAK